MTVAVGTATEYLPCSKLSRSSILSNGLAVYAVTGWEVVLSFLLQLAACLQAYLTACRQTFSCPPQLSWTAAAVARSSRQQPLSAKSNPALLALLTPVPRAISPAAVRKGSALLGPPPPNHHKRLTVVLDLDGTLLRTYPMDQIPAQLRHLPSACCMTYGAPGTTAATTLAVFTRPGCAEFLQRTAAFAELVLFTASSPAYARPLINLIDPTGHLFQGRRLYKDATVRWSGKDGVKDLASLGRDLSRVVLVDDNLFTFLLQPCNGVPCQPYHATRPDHQLLDVILPLLSILASVADVRPVLESRFGLPAWFGSKGYKAGV